jgi:hypothetical protein
MGTSEVTSPARQDSHSLLHRLNLSLMRPVVTPLPLDHGNP